MDIDMDTPWGKPQTIGLVAEGIFSVTTASHGGIMLSPDRAAAIPDYLRTKKFGTDDTAYEEDCDWCIPVLIFETEFRAYYARTGTGDGDKILETARVTLRHCHPDAYETYFGVALKPGESYRRDVQQFYADHRDAWLVTTAWGDWKEGVPKGMVGVCARVGGHENNGSSRERYFLVPVHEYRPYGPGPFVVDPGRHQEIPALA